MTVGVLIQQLMKYKRDLEVSVVTNGSDVLELYELEPGIEYDKDENEVITEIFLLAE